MTWIIAVAVIAVLGYLLDREIYFYEGVHLGPRLQAWLYDRWSRKYDEGKRASQLRDDEMLAQPLLDLLKNVPEPFVLDFATGTGRLSYALISRSEFRGHIIALDLSQGMLEEAAAKLYLRAERSAVEAIDEGSRSAVGVELLRHLSLPLPFPDAAFDVVCALEVLELFPDPDAPLHELTRVLRSGGVLLTSRGTEESGRKAKVKSAKAFTSLLERQGLEQIHIKKWWKLFDRVIAAKRGSSAPVGMQSLSDVLKCSSCGHIRWEKTTSAWECQTCGKELSITNEKIVLN
ncbi:MAG TPA: class I SAM-dependent methyltransferase [Anaerolineales bacterium]|nr:class I SAM-dependent methyltransferase [Anaerolineales bacterium]